MKKYFKPILKIVKGFEGNEKFTNHPCDPGGATKFGITQWRYTTAGYFGSVKKCTAEEAEAIYKKYYWNRLNLDLVNDFFICLILFDIVVNGGKPVKWLQRTLNVLNRNGKDFPDLKVDGKLGPNTAKILHKALKKKRGSVEVKNLIYEAVMALRTVYYIDISEKNPNLEAFTAGWISKRIIKLKTFKVR